MNAKNVELFFDCIDNSCMKMYEKLKYDYIYGIVETCYNILEQKVLQPFEEEDRLELEKNYLMINDVDFQKEEVRKAFQLCLLKGLKHGKKSNSEMTPDTIGLFVGYLVNKFYSNVEKLSILDPVVGTGNLLFSLANSLEKDLTLCGIDQEYEKYNLAKMIGEMLGYDGDYYFQDTLSFSGGNFDLIVADIDNDIVDNVYQPYPIILNHVGNLKNGGYIIALIKNDFFEQSGNVVFKENIQRKTYMQGLIKLSDSLFEGTGKSILILRKKGKDVEQVKQFLLVDLPSFEDMNAFNNAINKIDNWFVNLN